jgi:hypothetical protein
MNGLIYFHAKFKLNNNEQAQIFNFQLRKMRKNSVKGLKTSHYMPFCYSCSRNKWYFHVKC